MESLITNYVLYQTLWVQMKRAGSVFTSAFELNVGRLH
jgi:hypothetical protein